jgi:phospholipid/cholesterol/gamma-HCH transport system ATP-binding protein
VNRAPRVCRLVFISAGPIEAHGPRITAVTDVDTGIVSMPKTPMGEVLIRFSRVKKRFGPKVIYTDLNLEIRRGETTTILGASGSGKSVMLKMLIGLLKADAGSIAFDGDELTSLGDVAYAQVRRRIAYLFQGAALFDSFSVGENVAYGLREQYWKTMSDAEIRARVAQSLELVGLPGIEEMRPADLSGGMRKRVGLARTLALQPQVILYDEPTTGLDPINTARINHLILAIQSALKLTSIVVTHDMGTAFSVSNRLAMLGRGRVIAYGTKDEFQQISDPYVRDFIEGKAPQGEDVATLLSSS